MGRNGAASRHPRSSSIRLFLFTWVVLSLMPCAHAWHRDIRWASLSLTQQQETGINRLENQWQQTHGEVMAQIERDRSELETLLPTGDTQRIRLLQNRMMTNKMYLMNESMNTFLQKRDLLTPEQRSQLQKMLPNAPKKSLPGGPTTKASITGH